MKLRVENMRFSPLTCVPFGCPSHSSLHPRRCSCCAFPGARVPPAATRRGTRPSRNRDRHVRRESQAFADGFRPGLAHSCPFLPERATDECLSACCERPSLGFAISPSVLLPNYSLPSTGLPAVVFGESRMTRTNLNSGLSQTRFNGDDLSERSYLGR